MQEGTFLSFVVHQKPLSLVLDVVVLKRDGRGPLVCRQAVSVEDCQASTPFSAPDLSALQVANPGIGSRIVGLSARPKVSLNART